MSGYDDLVESVDSEAFAKKFFAPPSTDLSIEFGAATHIGKVRSKNDDHFAVLKRRRTDEILLTNLSPDDIVLTDDAAFGMVVADGMGGAAFGQLASAMVIKKMFELSRQANNWIMKYVDLEFQQIRERVEAYVHEMQSSLRESIQNDPALAGMGTTWTSAHLFPPSVLVVHIGDSRAYLLHDGDLRQITRDDTMSQAFIDAGMDPESVKRYRHSLVNAFGGRGHEVIPHIHELEIEQRDQLLLCTDGLTEMVSDADIAKILQQAPSPQLACDQLVNAALDRGGKDNITVVLASVLAGRAASSVG